MRRARVIIGRMLRWLLLRVLRPVDRFVERVCLRAWPPAGGGSIVCPACGAWQEWPGGVLTVRHDSDCDLVRLMRAEKYVG